MNAVKIADPVADLASQPFQAAEFPFQFLAALDKNGTRGRRPRFPMVVNGHVYVGARSEVDVYGLLPAR